MMTSVQVVETSVNVTINSPSQDYTHSDDHTAPTYDITPEFKPFTACKMRMKGSFDKYDKMLQMHDRKSWNGFTHKRLLICPPEHRATKKTLLAGYVSIPARKHLGHTTPQEKACVHLLHCLTEGIAVAI